MKLTPEIIGANSTNDKGGSQVGGSDHVQETIGERRIKDDLPPVGRIEQAMFAEAETLWRLHPAIGRENPEG